MPNNMTRLLLEWTRTELGGETVPLDLGAVAGQGIRKEDVAKRTQRSSSSSRR
jgi:hypothetical protein